MESNVQFNLKAFRKANGLSQRELANFLGVTQGFISRIEQGLCPMPDDKAEMIMANKDWTLYIDKVENHGEINIQAESPKKADMIPLVPFEAVAGPGTMVFDDEKVIDYYEVREFKGADFLIRVKGDSMSPKYVGGDLVACKVVKDVLFFQWGRVYVVYTKSQGVMIKRVEPAQDDADILCVSENTKYNPFEVPKEDIAGVALVIGSISLE